MYYIDYSSPITHSSTTLPQSAPPRTPTAKPPSQNHPFPFSQPKPSDSRPLRTRHRPLYIFPHSPVSGEVWCTSLPSSTCQAQNSNWAEARPVHSWGPTTGSQSQRRRFPGTPPCFQWEISVSRYRAASRTSNEGYPTSSRCEFRGNSCPQHDALLFSRDWLLGG